MRIKPEDLMGNQAVQRYLRGQIPAVLMPELVKAYQPWLHPTGVWRQYAVPQGEPEVQGLPALPSGADLSLLQPAAPVRSESDQFIVSSNEFGVTIFHPWSDTRIRIVEKEHRYKPEAWTYETRKWPNETPSIRYQFLIGDREQRQVLIAIGPGAFVEVEEPAPNRFAREWELPNSLSSLSGGFQVTIIEMSDNMFVPLPNEPIDVGTLLQAGGKLRDPDKHIWRGALTRAEYLQFWIGLGLGIAFGAIEFAVGVAAASAAVELATEATGVLSGLAETGIAPELAELAPEVADVATDVAMAADLGPSVTEEVGAQVGAEARLDQLLETMQEYDIIPERDLGYNPKQWEQFGQDYRSNPQRALADLEGRLDRLGVRAETGGKPTELEPMGRIPQTPKNPLDLPEIQEEIEAARRAQAGLPEAPGVKTTAGVEGTAATRSGYKPTKHFPKAGESTERAVIEGHEAGRAPDPHPFDRPGTGNSGAVRGSHAEKQAAVLSPDDPVGVSRNMCPDCQAWFRQRAIDRGVPQVVADPSGTRVFMPDGRVYFQPHPEGIPAPRGNR